MSSERQSQRFCRKCLLEDIQEEDFLRSMRSYLNGLDDSIKADEDTYQSRLAACKACDSLINGMCRICGCFVEYRAAIKKNHCPGIEKYW